MITPALIALLAINTDFTAVQYECSQVDPAKDGIRCAVANIDGMGATLLIRIHSRENSPAQVRARTKYMLRKVMDSFMYVGGTFIVQRVNLPTGQARDRTCSRSRRRVTEQCEDWDKADPALSALFRSIDP